MKRKFVVLKILNALKYIEWIVLYIVFIIAIGFYQASEDSFKGDVSNIVSTDINISKEMNTFVSKVTVIPQEIPVEDISVRIRDAWIEHRYRVVFYLEVIPFIIEIPLYAQKDGYNVVITFMDERSSKQFYLKRPLFNFQGQNYAYGASISNSIVYTIVDVEDLNWTMLNLIIRVGQIPNKAINEKVVVYKNSVAR